MVLAAGFGERMRPLTASMPKPLIPLAGRPLLDRVLDSLAAAGVREAVVNTHYLGDRIAAHLADHVEGRAAPAVRLSPEAEILETGGGVQHALPLLGTSPFYAVNSDSVWIDGPTPALARMARTWDPERMDALLLLFPTVTAVGYSGRGDFFMEPDGLLARRQETDVAPFVFTGVQILHPRLFDGMAPGKYSLNRVYDRALEAGRLFGLRHDGAWYHVGTPLELALAEASLDGRRVAESIYV